MNQEVKEIFLRECLKVGRIMPIPGVYRHFKEMKGGEDMIYCLNNVSLPLAPKEMLELNRKRNITIHSFHHTELNADTWIFRDGDRYYHPQSIEKEILPIYTALYGDRKTYVRPLSMFISKVDEGRPTNQEYRLELI